MSKQIDAEEALRWLSNNHTALLGMTKEGIENKFRADHDIQEAVLCPVCGEEMELFVWNNSTNRISFSNEYQWQCKNSCLQLHKVGSRDTATKEIESIRAAIDKRKQEAVEEARHSWALEVEVAKNETKIVQAELDQLKGIWHGMDEEPRRNTMLLGINSEHNLVEGRLNSIAWGDGMFGKGITWAYTKDLFAQAGIK
jgi:hypothetical protein